jgi:putative MATE family efflux protein
MKTPLLGDRSFYAGVIRIGLPVALQSLMVSSASLVDTVMIGSQGEAAVAAVGICAQFAMFLLSAYYGFCHGGIIFIAQFWGAKNERGISKAYGLMSFCMMLLGLIFGIAAVSAPGWIMGVYTNNEAIRRAGIPYLRILGYSFPLQVLAFAISSLLRSTENVKVPLYASVAGLVTNTFLNWVLIYGRLGAPALGVRGAAVATLISCAVTVAVLYAYALGQKNRFILGIKDHYGWSAAFIKQFFGKSVFIVCNELFIGIANMLINIILGRQDGAGIAAVAVFRVFEGLIFTFFKGLTSASAVMVGKRVGSGDHAAGYRDAKRFALLVPLTTLGFCLLLLPFRAPLLGLFSLGGRALSYGMGILLIYTFTGTLRSCNWISNDCFRAGGDPVFGAVVELLFIFLVTIPAMALGGLVFHLPFLAVFALMYLDDAGRIGIVLWHIRSGRWIKPVTPEGRRTLAAFHGEMRKHGHQFKD